MSHSHAEDITKYWFTDYVSSINGSSIFLIKTFQVKSTNEKQSETARNS